MDRKSIFRGREGIVRCRGCIAGLGGGRGRCRVGGWWDPSRWLIVHARTRDTSWRATTAGRVVAVGRNPDPSPCRRGCRRTLTSFGRPSPRRLIGATDHSTRAAPRIRRWALHLTLGKSTGLLLHYVSRFTVSVASMLGCVHGIGNHGCCTQ